MNNNSNSGGIVINKKKKENKFLNHRNKTHQINNNNNQNDNDNKVKIKKTKDQKPVIQKPIIQPIKKDNNNNKEKNDDKENIDDKEKKNKKEIIATDKEFLEFVKDQKQKKKIKTNGLKLIEQDKMKFDFTNLFEILPNLPIYIEENNKLFGAIKDKAIKNKAEALLKNFKEKIFTLYQEYGRLSPNGCLFESFKDQKFKSNFDTKITQLIDSLVCKEKGVKYNLVQDLTLLLKHHFPEFSLHPYGSYLTGLDIATSDIDLCFLSETYLKNKVVCKSEQQKVKKMQYRLANILARGGYSVTNNIIHATVPIIKFNYMFDFDIVINNDSGIRNSLLVKGYSLLDRRAFQLLVLIKYWTRQKGVYDASNQFMSSYSWHQLVIFYLQTTTPPVLPCLSSKTYSNRIQVDILNKKCIGFNASSIGFQTTNTQSISQLFYGFFKFYSLFDFNTDIVSTRIGKLSKIDKNTPVNIVSNNFGRHPIVIQDPFEDSFNVARSLAIKNFEIIKSEIYSTEYKFNKLINNGSNIELDQLLSKKIIE